MRGMAALAVLIGIVLSVQRLMPTDFLPTRTMALAIGFALIAATLLGRLAEQINLPRLSGYLIFGLLCGPFFLNLITSSMARELQVVNGVAIALIALIAGLEINLRRMRTRLKALTAFCGATIIVSFGGLFTMFVVAWPWLPIAPAASIAERLTMAGVLTTLVVSFSPTVTIAVIADGRARGPLSELVLAVVVLADLALILFFTLAMQAARSALLPGSPQDIGLFARLLWEIVGSIAYGVLLGSLFAIYLRYVGREVTVVLLGLCVFIMGTASLMHFESLLVALAAGLVVENIAPPEGDSLRDAVERGALPVLVVFFVAAGANLNLDALREIGIFALGVALARLAWIRVGTVVGLRAARLDPVESGPAWTGLIAQAGVTFGLATIVATEFADWGVRVQTLIVALSGLHVLVGPILFRAALARAGEIGRLDEPQQHAQVKVSPSL